MSILAFLGGRHDRKGWLCALNAAGSKLAPKTKKETLSKVTEQMIADDCRIIEECCRDIMESTAKEERRQKHLILYSRYSHLNRLEPYANHVQKKMIAKAKKLVTEARKFK